jgi:hypothetical protein
MNGRAFLQLATAGFTARRRTPIVVTWTTECAQRDWDALTALWDDPVIR